MERSLFEPGPKTEDLGVGWLCANQPTNQPQETPIFEQLVAEVTYSPEVVTVPRSDEPVDPLVGEA